MKKRIVTLAVIFGLGLPMAWYAPDDLRFLQAAIPAEARVDTLLPPDAGLEGMLAGQGARVGFTLGETYFRYDLRFGPLVHHAVGDRLTILFSPDVPPYVKPDTVRAKYRFVDIWLLLAALVFLAVLARMALARRH